MTNLKDINPLQEEIMRFIDSYIRSTKEPIPQKEIISTMEKNDRKNFTVVNALNTLLRKGYIRRAYMSGTNKTYYSQCRTI